MTAPTDTPATVPAPLVGTRVTLSGGRSVWVGAIPPDQRVHHDGCEVAIKFVRPRPDGEGEQVTQLTLSGEAADALLYLLTHVRDTLEIAV